MKRVSCPKPRKIKDRGYLDWLKTQKCVMCRSLADDPHHLPRVNTSRRSNDHDTIPVCRRCHDHIKDRPSWEKGIMDELKWYAQYYLKKYVEKGHELKGIT